MRGIAKFIGSGSRSRESRRSQQTVATAASEVEDLVVELAALHAAVTRALLGLAEVLEKAGVSREAYAERLLHAGKDAIAVPDHLNLSPEWQEVVISRARARYIEIIDAVYRTKSRRA